MPLTNPWVGYFTRSYEQIKSAVLTALATSTPEITDHTENNPIVKEVGIWAGIAEMLGYYADSMAREAYISTARLLTSGTSIASQLDYRVHGKVAASAEVSFYTDANVTTNYVIPAGTQLATEEGVVFITVADTTIVAGTSIATISAVQYLPAQAYVSYIADGSTTQTFPVPADAADSRLTVKVNGSTWLPVETLAYSGPTKKHYVQSVNSLGGYVRFGDGVLGMKPPTGASVLILYYKTDGAAGNVGQGDISQITSALPIPAGATTLNVTNNSRAAGGSDSESLESLRHRIPLSLRVMDRAVTRQDYIDNAELVNGVDKAGVVYTCGKWVDIYIIPAGGGLASPELVATTAAFIEPRRMITTRVRVFPAGEVRALIHVTIKVKPGYDPNVTIQAVKDTLALFLSYQNQEIGGTLFLSDLYEEIEAVEGVSNSLIASTKFTPFARPEPPTTTTLNWTATPQSGVLETAEWRLQAISSTQFQLFRNDAFQTTVTVGVPFSSIDIAFTISTAAYVTGDTYSFWTYPDNLGMIGNVVLQEPSIFVALPTDVTVSLQ